MHTKWEKPYSAANDVNHAAIQKNDQFGRFQNVLEFSSFPRAQPNIVASFYPLSVVGKLLWKGADVAMSYRSPKLDAKRHHRACAVNCTP
jgi:hypothetical protein